MSISKALLPALLASSALGAPAFGQTSNVQQQDGADEGLGDIIVTAQKSARGESVQRVPVAITAISGDAIKAAQALDIIDISHMAPNANFGTAATLPGFGNYSIRGIGVTGSVSSIDPAVNVVVDGMVYDFQGGTVQDAFDLEGVEILRGPQGILFGRNTTGGAVSLKTRRPSKDFGAQGEFTIGNYNRYDGAVSIEGPIVQDKVLGRITVLHRERDGYINDKNGGTFVPAPLNPTGSQPQTDIGRSAAVNDWIVRPTIVIKPNDRFDFTLLGEISDMRGGGNPARVVPGFDSALRNRFGYTAPTGDWETNQNGVGSHKITTERLVLEGNLDLDFGKITSITGFRHVNYNFAFEDGLPFRVFEFPDGNLIGSKQVSEELRFASTFSDVVDFVVGFYTDHHKLDVQERRYVSTALTNATTTAPVQLEFQGNYVQRSENYAGFASLNLHPVEGLTLTAGGRYSWEKKKLHISPIQTCTGVGFTGCPIAYSDFEKSWGNFSPKLGLNYQFSPDVMGYASWTKGFRSGQYNGRATALAQIGPVDPEVASSLELGFKTTFWDRKARFNITGFHTTYNDLQLTILSGATQRLQNAGAAKFYGIETELTLKPVSELELNGSFGWTHSNYERLYGPFNASLTVAQSLEKELLRAPEFTAHGSAAYTHEFGQDTSLTARTAYSWRSHYYVDVVNSPAAYQKAYGTLDLSLTLKSGHFSITAFGSNVTNVYHKELVNTVISPIAYGGQPATYGLTVRVDLF